MDLRDYAATEASAFAGRLIDAFETAARKAQAEAQVAIEKAAAAEAAARDEASRRAQLIEEASTREAALLASHQQTVQDFESRLAQAEAAQAVIRAETESATVAIQRDAQAREEVIRGEAQAAEAVLLEQLAHAASSVQTLREELGAAQQLQQKDHGTFRQLEARVQEADATAAALRQQTELLESRLKAAENEVNHLRAQARELETRLRDADTADATMRRQIEEFESRLEVANAATAALHERAQAAEDDVAAVRAELKSGVEERQRLASLLTASVEAIEALAGPSKLEDVLRTVAEQVGRHIDRTAVFTVRGRHLQGAHGAGIDPNLDVTKLIIPASLESVMTKALASGAAEHLRGPELDDVHPPLGGTPASALAIPITFAGDTVAVLYADSRVMLTDAHVMFASLIVRHTTAVLARLAEEMKTTKELRDYAVTLLQEVEQIFAADVAAGRSANERVPRLRNAVDFARQLYFHRTGTERLAVVHLLDEQIAAIVAAVPDTPFSRDLFCAIEQTDTRQATA
jgi:hypothetical protein